MLNHHFLHLVAGIAFLNVLSLPAAQGVETVDPNPEQTARCQALASEAEKNFCMQGYGRRALKFPEEAQTLGGFFSSIKMAIYRPAGSGPFPALILLHTCVPINQDHMRYWVKQALEKGYVAFVVDSWGQRGLSDGVCKPGVMPANPVRSRDAYEALQHLATFNFVDASRIGVMGFSQGGRVAYHLASKTVSNMFAPSGKRFAASISVYGECFNRSLGHDNIRSDIDIPLLSLLGELDEDGDPRECLPRLRAAKDKGAPVEWHVFSGVGHVWDHQEFSRPRRIPYFASPSGTVLFAYDRKATDESHVMAFDFLARYLKQKK